LGFEKARDRFPGAGSILNFRDDEDMPVICPTGQVFFWALLTRSGCELRHLTDIRI